MRNLIYAINVTVDGCCDHTKGIVDEEMLAYHRHLVEEADTFVYGRKTYELMVPYWPDLAEHPTDKTSPEVRYAKAFDSIKKIVVFSNTLDKVEGRRTELARGGLKDEVLRLKNEPGRSILTGGVDIPCQLIALGLVDEFHMVVHPVIAGDGRRLMEGILVPEKLKLKLVGMNTFQSGSTALRYLKQ
jgi:dihydrofolate reductase